MTPIETIGVAKLRRKISEISFQTKFPRKAVKSQEFCRRSLALLLHSTVHVHNPTRSTTVISIHHFEHVSEDLVSRILRKSPSKSCSLDAIPTNLLKDSTNIILPNITKLFNISLVSGVFPDQFKKAIIRPSLKKPHLDPEDYSNYRPIANLSFLSKTLEWIVVNLCRTTSFRVSSLHIVATIAPKQHFYAL